MISIDIVDILGRKLETMAEKMKPAGNHQMIWNANGQSSSIYFFRIKAGEFSQSRKMSLGRQPKKAISDWGPAFRVPA